MSRRDVYIFVFDGMADWEASFAIAGINNPQFQRDPGQIGRASCRERVLFEV